nr:aquaporin 1 [Echinococcus granulosus]
MPGPGVTDLQAIGMEIIITFFLELAIVALLDELRLPSFHPMNKINAFVLLVMVFFWIDLIALPISGACTNPARSLASVVINFSFERQYIYLIGPPIGSALSVLVQEIFLSPDASKARIVGLFNYRKVFNRREFYSTPPTNNLPPQAQNANVGLEYFRTTTTLSTLSVKSATSGTDFTRLQVRSVFPISSDSRWSRESRGSLRLVLTKPSDERSEQRRS